MGKQVLIISGFFILIMSCGEKSDRQAGDTATETDTLAVTAQESSPSRSFRVPDLSDDELVEIYEAQELIKIEQDKLDLRREYVTRAYRADYGVFVSMGIARTLNPETGMPIPDHLALRAARIDAMRWALYGTTWLSNDYQPAFHTIQGNLNQRVEVLDTANVGDSLFLFIATKTD